MISEKEYLKKVGANIKKIRLEKGLKQIDLAYACDFEKQNMYRIESGRSNLTIKTLIKIAVELDVTVNELLKF